MILQNDVTAQLRQRYDAGVRNTWHCWANLMILQVSQNCWASNKMLQLVDTTFLSCRSAPTSGITPRR